MDLNSNQIVALGSDVFIEVKGVDHAGNQTQITVSCCPRNSDAAPSEAQKPNRQRFAEASEYASAAERIFRARLPLAYLANPCYQIKISTSRNKQVSHRPPSTGDVQPTDNGSLTGSCPVWPTKAIFPPFSLLLLLRLF